MEQKYRQRHRRVDTVNASYVPELTTAIQCLLTYQRQLLTALMMFSMPLPDWYQDVANTTILLRWWEIHWLPIRQRIEYKLCLTAFEALHGISPGYIAAICVPVSSLMSRSRLRSADLDKLSFIRTNTEFGKGAFAHAGPTAWNNIPTAVRLSSTVSAFRSALKTYLFRVGYSISS